MMKKEEMIKAINFKFDSLMNESGQYKLSGSTYIDYVYAYDKKNYADYISEDNPMDSVTSVDLNEVKNDDIVIVWYSIGQGDGDSSFIYQEDGTFSEPIEHLINHIAQRVIEAEESF